jgi:gliding motility-associated-like protein
MKKYLLFLFAILAGSYAQAQCLTNSLRINTGYNPITGTAIAGGANGATPVVDPHWILTAVSPGVATAIAGTAIPGLIEVIPGNNADVIQNVGAWALNPIGNPGNWISCLNSNTYTDPGTGAPLNMTLGRPFKMCAEDDITISIYIANDNYISATNVDGTIPLTFSQPAGPITSYYTGYTFFTQTVHLTPGTHTINFVVNNYNVASSNPTGLNVYGTVSSATSLNSLVSESYASCASFACGATCNSISLPDTLHICEGGSDTLRATIVGTDPVTTIAWTPATGLSSSTVLRPEVTVGTTSGWYHLTVTSLSPFNLVNNGDFSLGNTGFTSTYTYVTGAGSLLPASTYGVTTNVTLIHPGAVSFGDHTTGTGNMMAVNGSGTPTSIWCQTIPVTPFTDYNFSAWVANWSTASTGLAAPILQFQINGGLIGTSITLTSPAATWVNFFATWNSGTSTTANICIYDLCTALTGNDFVLDDISFRPACRSVDSEYVAVNLIDTTHVSNDTLVCAPVTAVTLTAPAGYTSYTWNTGATTSSITVTSAGNSWVYCRSACTVLTDTIKVKIAPADTSYNSYDSTACASVPFITLTAPAGYPSYSWNTGATTSSINVTTPGNYWVYLPGPCTMVIDTFHVTYHPLPVINLGNDTAFCSGNTLVLSSLQPPGNTYQWSTGSTSDSIYVSTSGTYWLHVNNGCDYTDTIHIAVDPLPVVNLGPDTNNCVGAPVVLQSMFIYPSTYTYLWNGLATTSSITAISSGTYWLRVSSNAGCSATDTIIVQVLYDTVTLHTNDTALCRGKALQVYVTGNPVNTYIWTPTAGIATPTAGSPIILADTSALYIMTAHYPGCPDIVDSFYLDIQPNPIVYMGGNKQVCPYDTLHLHGAVSPAWYSHYTYAWAPPVFLDRTNNADVVFTAGDTQTVILTVTTPAGCIGVDSGRIYVFPAIVAHVDSVFNVCPHDSVQLLPSGGVAYNWSPALYLDDSTSAQPWVRPITSQTYRMVATSQYGCTDTLSISITVSPGAVIYMPDSVTIYPGESYYINPQTNCTNFFWTPSAGLSSPFISNPVASPLLDTKYIVYASTEHGCITADSISIYANPGSLIDVPNAFTPGTAPNSIFKVLKRGIATLNYFRIYNRWGNLVYEGKDIDAGWDGTFNGQPQPIGVFVYEIEAITNTGTVFHKHGNVTLLR